MARLDAITSATHSIIYGDLRPEDPRLAEARKVAVYHMYNKNMEVECRHLQTQIPADYDVLRQNIDPGGAELKDVHGRSPYPCL